MKRNTMHTLSPAHTTARWWVAVAALFAFVTFGTVSAAAADQWIHIKVEDASDDDETVTINLPVSLLSAAASMIPADVVDDAYDEVEIELDELSLSWAQLQDLWNQVRTSPDATYVTVESRDEKVKVWKEGDFLLINTTERRSRNGAEVDIKFPLGVVDALFSGPNHRPDFVAALNALADYGPGNLVSIRDGDETVRIWVDDQNETD